MRIGVPLVAILGPKLIINGLEKLNLMPKSKFG